VIQSQQERFGKTLHQILPKLVEAGVVLYYGRPVPPAIEPD
jgi:hypothetical protein